jgi:serine/threonine protein kinase
VEDPGSVPDNEANNEAPDEAVNEAVNEAEAPTIPGIDGLTRVGEGTTSTLYRGRHAGLRRDVAVKVLGRRLTGDDAAAYFRRDRIAVAALNGHPNIVSVLDSGISDDGQPYVVCDWRPRSLADRITERGALPWAEAADLGVDIAAALTSAHRQGVLHGDVKPSDIRLTNQDRPQLGDFGLARYAGAPDPKVRSTSRRLAHTAPEQIDGRKVDERTDVYALASTLHEAITSWPPFERSGAGAATEVTDRILTEDPPSLAPYGVPASVQAVLVAAMAKDPGQRPATAEAFAGSLLAAARSAGVDLRPPPPPAEPVTTVTPALGVARSDTTGTMPTTGPLPSGQPTVTGPVRRPTRSRQDRRARRLFAAATVAGLLAGGALLITRNHRDGSSSTSVATTTAATTEAPTTLAVTTLAVTTVAPSIPVPRVAPFGVVFDLATHTAVIDGSAATADGVLLRSAVSAVGTVQSTLRTLPGPSADGGATARDAVSLLTAMLRDLVSGSLRFDGAAFAVEGFYDDPAGVADLQGVIVATLTPVRRPVFTPSATPVTSSSIAVATSGPSTSFTLTTATTTLTVTADGKAHLIPITFTATGAQNTTFCFVSRQIVGPDAGALTMSYSSCDASRFVTVRAAAPGTWTVTDTFADGDASSPTRTTVTFTVTAT